MTVARDRRSASIPAALLGLVLAACAGAPRAEVDEGPMQSGRALAEALEELPGVVVTGRHFAFDGVLRVTVAAPDSDRASGALSAGFAVADSVEKLLNPQSPESEVSMINAAAGRESVRMSPWTEAMIVTALEWAERTGGAFDPTVGPLITAWGFGGDEIAVPSDTRLEAARRLVGWSKVQLDRSAHTVFLTEAGMELDLRAMAKGFALDRMREAMVTAGATSGIADYDGDLMFFGPGTGSSDDRWTIDVLDPYDPTRSFALLELPPGGFSTSVYYDRAVEIEGERIGHLIDPRTGYPARGLASVSVFATQGVVNDVLDTAFFVMGVEEGRRLAENLHDVEAIFVVDAEPGESSQVVTSPGLGRYVKKLRPPRRPLEAEER
jgi:thiamine biosynthesis lipoprotein